MRKKKFSVLLLLCIFLMMGCGESRISIETKWKKAHATADIKMNWSGKRGIFKKFDWHETVYLNKNLETEFFVKGKVGTKVRFLGKEVTIQQSKGQKLAFSLKQFLSKPDFYDNGVKVSIEVKPPSQTKWFRESTKIRLMTGTDIKKVEITAEKKLRVNNTGKVFVLLKAKNTGRGLILKTNGNTKLIQDERTSISFPYFLGKALWNTKIRNYDSLMNLKVDLRMTHKTRTKKVSWFPSSSGLVEMLMKGKLRVPRSKNPTEPKKATLTRWSLLGKKGYEYDGFVFEGATLKDLRYLAILEEKKGRTKRCGPYRKSVNFVKVGKPFYLKTELRDVLVKVYTTTGKFLGKKFFKNRYCPIVSDKKKPVSSFKTTKEKLWKGYINKVITKHARKARTFN